MPGAETDPRFWAGGISLVAHPQSPMVPAAHMNTRMIVTTRGWFGGGGDITPDVAPTRHRRRRTPPAFTPPSEPLATPTTPVTIPSSKPGATATSFCRIAVSLRGLGGIFYDHLARQGAAADFAFTREVGQAFLDAYPAIVRQRMGAAWTAAERDHQLIRRGRYVEFNLLHDRGTLFGLKTGGNVEAIPDEPCRPRYGGHNGRLTVLY